MKLIKSSLDVGAQVVRCCLEHAASVAKIFLTSDVVVTEIKEAEPANAGGNPMDNSGTCTFCFAMHYMQGYCLWDLSVTRCVVTCLWLPHLVVTLT